MLIQSRRLFLQAVNPKVKLWSCGSIWNRRYALDSFLMWGFRSRDVENESVGQRGERLLLWILHMLTCSTGILALHTCEQYTHILFKNSIQKVLHADPSPSWRPLQPHDSKNSLASPSLLSSSPHYLSKREDFTPVVFYHTEYFIKTLHFLPPPDRHCWLSHENVLTFMPSCSLYPSSFVFLSPFSILLWSILFITGSFFLFSFF